MKFAQAKAIAQTYCDANIPVFIEGAPGVGKSALVHEMAREAGATVCDIRLSLFDPVDLRGIPSVIEGQTVWARPAFWPRADVLTYLFFDEMDRAPLSVKNAALQIVLDRRIGEHELPGSVRIFAAGNGATDKGATSAMGTALNARFGHISLESDVDQWCDWACGAAIHPAIIAFLKMRGKVNPAIFHDLNPARDAKAYPSARSWERISRLTGAAKAIRLDTFSGIIGPQAAGEFEAFFAMFDRLPSLDSILNDPHGAPVYSDLSLCYAIASGLARAATPAVFPAVLTYAARLPREFEIMTVSAATRRDPALANCAAYVAYAQRNQGVFA